MRIFCAFSADRSAAKVSFSLSSAAGSKLTFYQKVLSFFLIALWQCEKSQKSAKSNSQCPLIDHARWQVTAYSCL